MSKLIIGLTGIFGSGKSTVANLFEDLGATVIGADLIAHEALWKESPVYDKIEKLFPEAEKNVKGLDRKSIAAIVFKDAVRREALEKVIHPYVRTRIETEIADAEGMIVVEVPLLFESGFDWLCDVTLTIEASEEVILKRMKEKGWNAEDVRARWKAQMPLAEKIKRSDHAVRNDKGLEEIKKEIKKLWKNLHEKMNQR